MKKSMRKNMRNEHIKVVSALWSIKKLQMSEDQ